jgi:hypothetical protein
LAINQALIGGKTLASDINQYGDLPGTIATASSASQQTITASAFATLPTTPVTASLTTTHASTLVMVIVSGAFGAGSLAAPTNTGALSYALSGSVTQAASDPNAVFGASPGVQSSGTTTQFLAVPAGTLTATVQARWNTASGITVRNVTLQLVAIRPL